MTSEIQIQGCKNGSSTTSNTSDLYNHVISNTFNASAKNQVGEHS